MRSIVAALLIAVLLIAASCAKHDDRGPVSLATLSVNGPGLDGVVYTGSKQFYTLSGINAGQQYTLRTMITLTTTDGATYVPDGTLTIKLYPSEASYKNNDDPEQTIVSGQSTTYPDVIEQNFSALQSGNYVAVISGTSLSNPKMQFFYDLRIMSGAALTSFTTTTLPAYGSQSLSAGYLNIYNVSEVTDLVSSSSYTISLTTDSTTTSYFPQLFLYSDPSLTRGTLMLSSIPTTSYHLVYLFQNGVQLSTDPSCTLDAADSITLPDVYSSCTLSTPFTGTIVNPYVVIKGIYTSLTYSLTITQ